MSKKPLSRQIQSLASNHSRKLVFLFDALLICLSIFCSFLIRLGFRIEAQYFDEILISLPVVLVIKWIVFFASGFYQEIWRTVSIHTLKKLLIGNFFAFCLLSILALFVVYAKPIPRGVLVIDALLCFVFTGGARFGYRAMVETFSRSQEGKKGQRKRVIIIGAGAAGEFLVRESFSSSHVNMEMVGILDDDHKKKGRELHGVRVLGPIDDLLPVCASRHVDLVIIAIATLVGKGLKRVLEICESARDKHGVQFKIIPGTRAILDGMVSVSQTREVNAEDLLRRLPVKINTQDIGNHLLGKTVLVTGAAGSIGSELVRQIIPYLPRKLLLLDRAENAIFNLQQELKSVKTNTELHYLVGDACNRQKIESIFDHFRPEIVFHAAAYKHVPLMEHNPEEAIINNTVSTTNLVNLANQFDVSNFVLISTDKAVKPTSIMGASKRICEKIVEYYDRKKGTIFTTVRFGNVIGSSGSLVPLLLNQIKAGGPVTVTHKDIERFFMTIPEAVRLTMQAAIMSKGGETFVLDMGNRIKINELAEDLIRLSGYTPHEQIEIVYTGLRPGEKMFEDLWNDEEEAQKTSHPGILEVKKNKKVVSNLQKGIDRLLKTCKPFNRAAIVREIRELVPETTILDAA